MVTPDSRSLRCIEREIKIQHVFCEGNLDRCDVHSGGTLEKGKQLKVPSPLRCEGGTLSFGQNISEMGAYLWSLMPPSSPSHELSTVIVFFISLYVTYL